MVLNLQQFPVEGINYKVATIRIVLSSSSTRTPVLYWLASRASAINMVLNLQLFPVEGINLKVATILVLYVLLCGVVHYSTTSSRTSSTVDCRYGRSYYELIEVIFKNIRSNHTSTLLYSSTRM
jgi:hypothetical protein